MATPDREYSGPPESISLARFPEFRPDLADPAAEHDVEVMQKIVTLVRDYRANLKLSPRIEIRATVRSADGVRALGEHSATLQKLGNAVLEPGSPEGALGLIFDVTGELDAELEVVRQRKRKELEQVEKQIASLEKQFADEPSLSRKPAHIVEGMRKKLEEYKAQRDRLLSELQ